MPRNPNKDLIRLALLVAALCVAILAASPTPAGAKRPQGIDVSRFNGAIDWAQVAGAGINFAFVQASRGSGLDCAVRPESCGADPLFATNRVNAAANGIRVGPYHRAFATGATMSEARADAAAEASVFITAVSGLNSGELVPVLDVETPFTGLNAKRLTAWIRLYVKRVRSALGRKPMIYTNYSSWGATGHTLEFAKARYPLWVAQWGVAKPLVPASNWAGRGWSVWQYTSSGSVPGIVGRVDMNRARVRLRKLTIR
jgi:GH25 family lysozyme M1 (1,4-beta-N-acetylmuramidase)